MEIAQEDTGSVWYSTNLRADTGLGSMSTGSWSPRSGSSFWVPAVMQEDSALPAKTLFLEMPFCRELREWV